MAKKSVSLSTSSTTTEVKSLGRRDRVIHKTHNSASTTFVEPKTNLDIGGVLSLVFLLLLFVSVMRSIANGVPLTFTGFLNSLQQMPTIDMSGVTQFVSNANAYTYIPIFGPILQFLTTAIAVVAYIAIGIAQVIVFLVWVLGYVFV